MSPVISLNRRAAAEDPARLHDTVEALARQLQTTAIERDRMGGHAAAERELIRASGLLTLTVPTEFGGPGGSWSTHCQVLRRLAQADSALAKADWDAFGQKQTDSGNVEFTQALISHHEVLQAPGTTPTPRSTLRSQVAQLVLVNLYLGIGLGAFEEAVRYSRDEARPWFASGEKASVDDTFVQHRYAQLWLLLKPAIALADQAAHLLDDAFARGADVTARDRGEVAIAVAEAKVLAHRAGIEVSSQLFELTGARSTSARYGLDRFWRNVRVHTLHDPIDYKLRDIGRHVLTGAWPEPTAYS